MINCDEITLRQKMHQKLLINQFTAFDRLPKELRDFVNYNDDHLDPRTIIAQYNCYIDVGYTVQNAITLVIEENTQNPNIIWSVL